MAKVTEIITNLTCTVVVVDGKDYIKLPLGSTGTNPPFDVQIGGVKDITFYGEWEITYDDDNAVKDSTPNIYCEFLGGRPTGR